MNEMASTRSQDFSQNESLLTVDTLSEFRERWDRLQTGFVIEPSEAALKAEDLIQDIAEALAASTVRRKSDLASVNIGSIRFPEELWITLQRCRLLMNAIQMPMLQSADE
jgi:hypothetical protein